MGIKSENYFLLKDGTVIKNLFELSKALERMPEDIFRFHVNKSRNDFYNWVNDIVQDKNLAEQIKNSKDRSVMQKKIAKKIQKEAEKGMKKKPAAKAKAKKPKIVRSKQIKVLKNKTDSLKNKIHNFFFKEKTEKKQTKKHPYVNPTKTAYGIHCPYKTIHCGVLEFVFGIIIGLLIAFVLSTVI